MISYTLLLLSVSLFTRFFPSRSDRTKTFIPRTRLHSEQYHNWTSWNCLNKWIFRHLEMAPKHEPDVQRSTVLFLRSFRILHWFLHRFFHVAREIGVFEVSYWTITTGGPSSNSWEACKVIFQMWRKLFNSSILWHLTKIIGSNLKQEKFRLIYYQTRREKNCHVFSYSEFKHLVSPVVSFCIIIKWGRLENNLAVHASFQNDKDYFCFD